VVGARCAGSVLAMELARSGADVLLVDRDTFPSDTLSTHILWPNSLDRLERLGVLDRLRAEHELPLSQHRFRVLGREVAGSFTAIGGYDRAAAPRRIALDAALVRCALDAGADARFGERVTGLIGRGTENDPVRGVELAAGERFEAPHVFGADGRASFVARELGLEKRQPLAGEMEFLFAYWHGLPANQYINLDVEVDRALNWFPCEDDVHLLGTAGPPGYARGTPAERERRYTEDLGRFPETFDAGRLEGAERVSELRVAPEPMMRGFYRQAAGPGWALVGDAGHFKHPVTAQGIADAIEQAIWLAEALAHGDSTLDGYEEWRDTRAAEHYEWSFQFARWPVEEVAGPLFDGMAADAQAERDFRDSFSRLVTPAHAMSRERLAAWFGDPPSASA
jgi:2-polyprenyl-6-methoxyphenol hydroxylase-like FAD-dependent oxidoreductase